MNTPEKKKILKQCLVKLSLQSGFNSFNSFRIQMENKLISSIKKEKLEKCLIILALNSGFDSFIKFKNYKENLECFSGYKAVYPKFQDISKVDDKIYVKNLKVMTGQNLYDPKTGSMVKLTDKL